MDPMNMTFNKSGNKSMNNECPYKDNSGTTGHSSTSSKKQKNNREIRKDLNFSLEQPNFILDSTFKGSIFSIQESVSKSDIVTPNKTNPLIIQNNDSICNIHTQMNDHIDTPIGMEKTASFMNVNQNSSNIVNFENNIKLEFNANSEKKIRDNSRNNPNFSYDSGCLNKTNDSDKYRIRQKADSFNLPNIQYSYRFESNQNIAEPKIINNRHYRNPKTLILSSKIPECFLGSEKKARQRKNNSTENAGKHQIQAINGMKLTFKSPWKLKPNKHFLQN